MVSDVAIVGVVGATMVVVVDMAMAVVVSAEEFGVLSARLDAPVVKAWDVMCYAGFGRITYSMG